MALRFAVVPLEEEPARSLEEATEVLESAARGALTITSLASASNGSATFVVTATSNANTTYTASTSAMYVIVSLEDAENPDVRGFWIRDGKIDEAELDVE